MRKTRFRLEVVFTVVLFFFSAGCTVLNGDNAGGVSDLLRNEMWSSKPCPVIPDGMWQSSSGDWMKVEGNKVRIGRRGQAAYAELENRANGEVIFEQYDFAEKWPQRLRILRGGNIEYTRDESPPFPKQILVFVKQPETRIEIDISELVNLRDKPLRLLSCYGEFANDPRNSSRLSDATSLVAETVGPRLRELVGQIELALHIPEPTETIVKRCEEDYAELYALCESICRPKIRMSPLGRRWEFKFAESVRQISVWKDRDGKSRPRGFSDMFRRRLTITRVKLRVLGSSDEYWVSLQADSTRRWDSSEKKLVKNAAGMLWVVGQPDGYNPKKKMKMSNARKDTNHLVFDKPFQISSAPFDRPQLQFFVCKRGEKAERLKRPVEVIRIDGACPFFKDKDSDGDSCRSLSYVIHRQKAAEVQCWVYGTESAINLPQMLKDSKGSSGGSQK